MVKTDGISKLRFQQPQKLGWIELITGCMFAGKTEEFIRRLKRHRYAQHKVIIFKPVIDTRYSTEDVVSHSGTLIDSFPVSTIQEMKKIFNQENAKQPVDVIGVDEIQFFDLGIVDYINELASGGVIIITTGLNKNFRGGAFQNVDRLLVEAEYIDKLTAICHICGNIATNTQRLVGGKPAKKNDPLILVDGKDSYEARCRNCYQKPK